MNWRRFQILGLLLLLPFIMGQSGGDAAKERTMPPGNAENGKAVYEKRCVWCHGWDGAGRGPAWNRMMPKPRDFTKGKFRIRTTTSGKLPTDRNLFDAISNGLHGTTMPKWKGLISDQEISDVAQYIKGFTKKFKRWAKKNKPLPEIQIGPEVVASPESIERGKELFMKKLECWKCHGKSGKASGPSMPGLKDDWGFPIRPANFTKPWNFRGGSSRRDIYLRFNTGVNGTPMPSYADQLDNEKSWDLANFVRSMGPDKKPAVNEIIRAQAVIGDIPMDANDPVWQTAESNYFPLLPQVIIEPRRFWLPIDDVYIKAVHNGKEVAFLIQWDDPTKSPIDPNPLHPYQYRDNFYLQFPSKLLADTTKKPYFISGDKKRKAEIWRFDSESMDTSVLLGKGIYKTKVRKDAAKVETKAEYNDGQWTLLLKRPMKTENENDLQFEVGKFIPISFHAQDGSAGDVGTLRTISTWYWLMLQPDIPNTRYAAAGVVFILVIGLEFVWIRRQSNA